MEHIAIVEPFALVVVNKRAVGQIARLAASKQVLYTSSIGELIVRLTPRILAAGS